MKAKRRNADSALVEPEPVASATECTGLMPALPENDAQDENEASLYGIHSARGARGEKCAGK